MIYEIIKEFSFIFGYLIIGIFSGVSSIFILREDKIDDNISIIIFGIIFLWPIMIPLIIVTEPFRFINKRRRVLESRLVEEENKLRELI